MNRYFTKRQARRGITLIEVGVASTLCTLLASLGIGLIYNLFTLNSATKSQADQQRTIARFAETFRADVQRATSAESEKAENGGTMIAFSQESGRTVQYMFNQGEIVKQVLSGEKLLASDSFLFCEDTAIDASLEVVKEKTLAILTIHQLSTKKTHKNLPSIVAVVGIHPGVIEILLPPEKEEADGVEEPSEEATAVEKKEEKEAVE